MKSLQDLQAFSACCEMPVALDETLDNTLRDASSPEAALLSLQAVAADCKAAAVVVKPSLLRWGPSFAVSIAQAFAERADKHSEYERAKVSHVYLAFI